MQLKQPLQIDGGIRIVSKQDMPLLFSEGIRTSLIEVAKEQGFYWVTLDLIAYGTRS